MALREIADVIAFDQRGTGFSKPNLTCLDRLALPLNTPPAREAAIKELRDNAEDCAFYWHNIQRVDLTGYNTNESADDLEDLRKALGAAAPGALRFAPGRLPEPSAGQLESVHAAPPEPTDDERELAAALASGIEDESLRKIVAKAALASLGRTR